MDSRMQRLTMQAASVALVVVMLNVSIVNPALPDLARNLQIGSNLGWAVNAYTLVVATLLLAAGAFGDRIGHRRILLTGLWVSVVGALVTAVAPVFAVVLVGRALQGAGAALVQPATLALLLYAFTGPHERTRALALWGAVSGLGIALGPVVGGVLVDAGGWRGPFVLLVVACLLALWISLRVPFETPRSGQGKAFDTLGLILIMTALGTGVLALAQGRSWGWGSLPVVTLSVVAVLAFAAFLRTEKSVLHPLVDFRLRHAPGFVPATLTGLLAFFATFGLLPFLTVLLQTHFKLSATHAGLLVLCFPVGFALGSTLSGRLTVARGPRVTLLLGLGLTTLTTLLWYGVGIHSPLGLIALNFGGWGLGLGLSLSALTIVALGHVPQVQAGMASGLLNTARQLGTALGVAIFGAFTASASSVATYLAGLHLGALLAGGVLFAGLVFCLIRLSAPTGRPPE